MKLFGVEIVSPKTLQKLTESLTIAERALEDLGWVGLNGNSSETSQTAAKESYELMVKRSRLSYITNPLTAQAVNLTTFYTFGSGLQAPKVKEGNEEVQSLIDKFWKDPDNKLCLTESEAQLKLSNKLQYDGELAFVLQVDTDGSVYVRLIDPLSIASVIFDNKDTMRPMFYKRLKKGSLTEYEYIPDIDNGVAVLKDAGGDFLTKWSVKLGDWGIKPEDVMQNSFVFHVKTNNDILDVRGIPDVWRALGFLESNRKINSDMATFINAQSQYAVKKKVQGTKAQVNAMASRLRQDPNTLRNPSYQAGSTLVQNSLVDTEMVALPSSTGQLFEVGIRRTLLMVASNFGIMEHYFGDPGTGNLATATAMELPMLKKFMARQKMWESIFARIINFQLDMAIVHTRTGAVELNEIRNRVVIKNDFEDREFDIDFPPILDKDVKMLVDAYATAKKEGLMPIETAQRMFLIAAGVNNIEEEMEKEFQEPQVQNPFGFPPDPNADVPSKTQKEPVKEKAVVRNIEGNWFVFSKNNRKIGGPYLTEDRAKKRMREVKESVASTDIKKGKTNAVRMADKNKAVLTEMGRYLKSIAREYRAFDKAVKENRTTTHGAEGKYAPTVRNVDDLLKNLKEGMVKAGNEYLPKAVELGRKYAESHVTLSESVSIQLREKKLSDFTEQQLRWNRHYVETSLIPAIKKKLFDIQYVYADSQAEAFSTISETVASFETRVASYAAAFWTVEERTVKLVASQEGQMCNFIGASDDKLCEDCAAAFEGNPWPVSEVPVPGEQQCLGACRHAIQILGDEQLSEADINLLKESEKQYKSGIRILGMEE